MYKILDWKSSDDTRDIVHIVVQALVEGRNVALPAETAYHAVTSGLNPKTAKKFEELAQSKHIGRCALFLRSAQELLDYVTHLSPVASRVAHRAWPGPLVLDLPIGDDRSLVRMLPHEFLPLICKDGRAAFRVAAHNSIQHALRLMSGPLVAAPIQQNSRPAQRADIAGDIAGSVIVVDDGGLPFDDFSTMIRIDGNECRIASEGVTSGEALYRHAQFIVLLVCTGNTCRSPMAEALMRNRFEERFPSSNSSGSPVYVASAGLSAFPGGPAAPEAQSVMAARGLDLTKHQSYSVTEHTLRNADLILTMTRSHRQALLDIMPEIKPKVHLVSGSNSDVSDPYGCTEEVYRECADQIDGYVRQWVERLDGSIFPNWK